MKEQRTEDGEIRDDYTTKSTLECDPDDVEIDTGLGGACCENECAATDFDSCDEGTDCEDANEGPFLFVGDFQFEDFKDGEGED